MFEGWDSFYLLIGGGSGALIGLLFVVATLNAGLDRDTSLRGASLYMTPIVYHLAAVLVASAIALTPRLPPSAVEILLAIVALGGLAHAVRILLGLRVFRPQGPPHWSDVWLYGAVPAVIYLVLGAISLGIAARAAWAPDALGLAMVALLLIAIRNAWDLVTWLAPGLPPRG
jgi:hypothetical protein